MLQDSEEQEQEESEIEAPTKHRRLAAPASPPLPSPPPPHDPNVARKKARIALRDADSDMRNDSESCASRWSQFLFYFEYMLFSSV